MSEERNVAGWVELYHPAGVKVKLALPDTVVVVDTWGWMLASVTNAISAGWLTTAPGLEEGEEKQEIGYVVHKVKNNDDGTDTDVVDLYANNDGMKFSVLTVYLNSDEEATAFETASGLKLNDIPVYVGSDKIERGKSRQGDKFIIKAPRPFFVASKANPKWNADEAKRAAETQKMYPVPRRKFSSWPGLVISQPSTVGPANGEQSTAAHPEMMRHELSGTLKQIAEWTSRTYEQVAKEFCDKVGLANVDALKPERLQGACEYLRKELQDIQSKPTKAEIGKLPTAVVDDLLKTLKQNGHSWFDVRKIAYENLKVDLAKGMTLDDVAKIDNWSAKHKTKAR